MLPAEQPLIGWDLWARIAVSVVGPLAEPIQIQVLGGYFELKEVYHGP